MNTGTRWNGASQTPCGIGSEQETRCRPNLSAKFNEAILDMFCRAEAEAIYNHTRFLSMVIHRGGFETARYLLNATTLSEG